MPIPAPASRELRAAVVTVVVGGLAPVLVPTGLTGPGRAVGAVAAEPAREPRTWVGDAGDDAPGARWASQATGTSEVTAAGRDTV